MESYGNSIPRINSQMLERQKGNVVRLVGKVLQSQDNAVVVEASDQGQVNVTLSSQSNLDVGSYYDIIGRVDENLVISEMNLGDFGNDMDLAAYDKMVVIAQSFPDIFGW
ncbi:MAG: hypothetical protein SGCHY_000853 [Lobulomycetales sp.]